LRAWAARLFRMFFFAEAMFGTEVSQCKCTIRHCGEAGS